MGIGESYMNKMNVATALNKKYLAYTSVMLQSLCVNNERPIRAFLLHTELELSDIKCLEDSLKDFDIEIIAIKMDTRVFDERLPRTTQWSVEMYYRLALPDVLPDYVERILYLDVDIIVNKSVAELYDIEFDDYEIIATEDCNGRKSWEMYSAKQQEMFGPLFEQGYIYFNSGVMLLNIAEIRKRVTLDTYMDAIEEWNYEMLAPDQDILNYVHWDRVGYVDGDKYDLFANLAHNRGMNYEQVKSEASIIHFAGYKPWNTTSLHFEIEQLWWDYASKNPFYFQLLEGFLNSTLTSTLIENYIGHVCNKLVDTRKNLKEAMEMSDKLLELVSQKKRRGEQLNKKDEVF